MSTYTYLPYLPLQDFSKQLSKSGCEIYYTHKSRPSDSSLQLTKLPMLSLQGFGLQTQHMHPGEPKT